MKTFIEWAEKDSLHKNFIDGQMLRITRLNKALREIVLTTTIEEARKIANIAIDVDHELSIK